jgi:hypothetical protein
MLGSVDFRTHRSTDVLHLVQHGVEAEHGAEHLEVDVALRRSGELAREHPQADSARGSTSQRDGDRLVEPGLQQRLWGGRKELLERRIEDRT